MNKEELIKKCNEIILKTNGGADDYVVALCEISQAIHKLDELSKVIECEYKIYTCTKCNHREEDDERRESFKFCPNCGAKIKRGKSNAAS